MEVGAADFQRALPRLRGRVRRAAFLGEPRRGGGRPGGRRWGPGPLALAPGRPAVAEAGRRGPCPLRGRGGRGR